MVARVAAVAAAVAAVSMSVCAAVSVSSSVTVGVEGALDQQRWTTVAVYDEHGGGCRQHEVEAEGGGSGSVFKRHSRWRGHDRSTVVADGCCLFVSAALCVSVSVSQCVCLSLSLYLDHLR